MPSSWRGTGNSAGQRGVVGVVRLERVHGRLEVLARHVDVVRRGAAPRDGEGLDPTPRLQPLVGELGVQPAVAGIRHGIQRGQADGAVVGLVDHAPAEPLVPRARDDEVGALAPDGAGDLASQRHAVLDRAVAQVAELDDVDPDPASALALLRLADDGGLVGVHRVDARLAPGEQEVADVRALAHPAVDGGGGAVLDVVGVRDDAQDAGEVALEGLEGRPLWCWC